MTLMKHLRGVLYLSGFFEFACRMCLMMGVFAFSWLGN
jgi:hypothetical protein